jgi:hypothetical protein
MKSAVRTEGISPEIKVSLALLICEFIVWKRRVYFEYNFTKNRSVYLKWEKAIIKSKDLAL